MELTTFLTWLISDGVGAITGWLLSNLIEGLPVWAHLNSYQKRLYIMGLSLLVAPLLALALYWLISSTPPDRSLILVAFQAGFVTYAGSQYGHAPALKASGLRKEVGQQVLDTYQNNLGLGGALTADGGTRFANTCERIVKSALQTE